MPSLHQRAQRGARDLQRLQGIHRRSSSRGGESIDQRLLVGVELAFHSFENRKLHSAGRITRVGQIFAGNPFFSHHARQQRLRRPGSAPQAFFSRRLAVRQVLKHAKLGELILGSFLGARGRSRHSCKVQSHCPSSVMR